METGRVGLTDVEVEPLLAGLSVEYETRYGENVEMTMASEDEFDPPAGLFIVLMDGPITASGGGYRRFTTSTFEVKRMWTSPLYRRRGLAARVLQTLEEANEQRSVVESHQTGEVWRWSDFYRGRIGGGEAA